MDCFINGKSLFDIINPSLFMPFQRTLTSNDDLNTNLPNGIYKTTDQLPKNCDPNLIWSFIIILAYDSNSITQFGIRTMGVGASDIFLKVRYISVKSHVFSGWHSIQVN